jgi:hypothetical protein
MQKVSRILVAGLLTVLAGCASSSVMDVSSDTVIITTSADPSCGRTGAQDVASRRAAYETLRRGFDRYVILDSQAEDNTGVVGFEPVEIETRSKEKVKSSGDDEEYSEKSDFSISGGDPIIGGSHDQQLEVKMFRLSDPGAKKAVDARRVLGPDWRTIIAKDPAYTC